MRALDLFAGAGGWSLACAALGIDEVGVDNLKEARATRAAAGFQTHPVASVWEIDYALLRGLYDGSIASPPCQTFSAAGKGAGRKALDDVLRLIRSHAWMSMDRLRTAADDLGDERTALVLTPLHAAYMMRPEWIAWEQVPTVLPVWEACAEVLREMGYSVWTGNLQAEMYGVPQTRKRAFLIASRTHHVTAPTPTHSRYYPRNPTKLDPGVQKWVSMAEALGWGLEQRPSPTVTGGGTETGGAEPIAHLSRYMGDIRASRGTVRSVDAPAPTLTASMDNGNFGWVLRNNSSANAAERELGQPAPTLYFGQRSNYVAWEPRGDKPEWPFNRPSTTIVGTFKPEIVAAPGYRTTVSRQNAEGSVRVTVEEAGILQSFPADFPWQGAKGKQYLQVGNAVPPLLAKHVLVSAALGHSSIRDAA